MANKIDAAEIIRLRDAYMPDFESSWKRMELGQKVLDGVYKVLEEEIENFDPYHSPVHRASIQKTVERIVTYEPKPHVEPEGESQRAINTANEMEKDSKRWLEGFEKHVSRAPWSAGSWQIEARGKVAYKFGILKSFMGGPPKRKENEHGDDYNRRVADYHRDITYGCPFTYEPIDTLRHIIHPPTMSVNPSWVIQLSEMDIYQVLEIWPHFKDPMGRLAAKSRDPVIITEYCNKFVRGILADDVEVSRLDDGQASIIPNDFRRVIYDVIYSPYGQLPMSVNRGAITREERLAVSQIDLLMQNIRASDRVMSFILLYLGRFGQPLPYGNGTAEDFYKAVRDGYLFVPQGSPIPGVLKQDVLPPYVENILRWLGEQRDYVTLPPVAVGLGSGGNSGIQQSQVLAQVDLQGITERKSIANAMARALSECWYACKYIIPESVLHTITKVKREDIPDAPRITIDMEPPDENRQARRLAMAESQKDILPVRERIEAGGRENASDLEFERIQDQLKVTPESIQFILANAQHLAEITLAKQAAEKAAKQLPAPIPPPQEQPMSPMEGMPPEPAMPGSPEEMQAQQEAAMQMQPTVG